MFSKNMQIDIDESGAYEWNMPTGNDKVVTKYEFSIICLSVLFGSKNTTHIDAKWRYMVSVVLSTFCKSNLQ